MIDREKLREILRRADAKRTTTSPSAPDDARERRRQVLERAGLVEPSQPKTERPPESQAVEAVPAPQAPVPSSQDVVQAPASDWSPILTAEEMRTLQEALGLPPIDEPEELGERDFLEREGDDVEPIEPPPVPEDVIKDEIKRRAVELSARYKDIEEIISGLSQDERMKPYLEEFNRRAGKLLERLEDKLRKAERTGVIATQQQLINEFNGIFENLEKLISDYISKCEADQKTAAAESHGDDGEVELSKEGEELLEFMRVELADLPNPFERMEAGELNYSFVDKQKEIERRVAKIAAEVLKKFGAANGDKLKELEAIVQQITDELLDRDEAAAVFYLVDVLRRGRNGFGVVLDEERMLEARNRLFERGEVSPLSAGRSDFEVVDNKLFWQSISVASKLLEGVGGDKGRQFLKRYDSIIFPDDVKRNYAILLSAGKVLRCLAMLAFVKYRSENKFDPLYPPDLLSFEANSDFKQEFEELYRGAIQRLNDKIKNGEVKIDTSDDRAVKEALRPYSDFAVANGVLGFDWKQLCRKYGVN